MLQSIASQQHDIVKKASITLGYISSYDTGKYRKKILHSVHPSLGNFFGVFLLKRDVVYLQRVSNSHPKFYNHCIYEHLFSYPLNCSSLS